VVDGATAGRTVRDRVHTRNLSASGPASLSDGSLAGVLVAVLIVVVALCWVLRDEDRSRWLVQIIHAWRVGRARAAPAAAKNAGRRIQTTAAASPPGLPSRGTGAGDTGSYHPVSPVSLFGRVGVRPDSGLVGVEAIFVLQLAILAASVTIGLTWFARHNAAEAVLAGLAVLGGGIRFFDWLLA
jgi:hypothetical protein